MDYEPKINPINEFLEERIAFYERMASDMQAALGGQDERFDELFREALREVWG
jgi:hypothetical protein